MSAERVYAIPDGAKLWRFGYGSEAERLYAHPTHECAQRQQKHIYCACAPAAFRNSELPDVKDLSALRTNGERK